MRAGGTPRLPLGAPLALISVSLICSGQSVGDATFELVSVTSILLHKDVALKHKDVRLVITSRLNFNLEGHQDVSHA